MTPYEEMDANSSIHEPVLDNDKDITPSVPFYSASQLDPWSGYSDEPSDNILSGRSLSYIRPSSPLI